MTDGVDLRSLLERVQKAQGPDPFLDKELIVGFDLRDDAMWVQWSDGTHWVARPVTGSIDAATQLISKLLPDWWWSCGYCQLTNDATVHPRATVAPDFRASQAAHDLVDKYKRFDEGFDGDRRGGNVPLALLSAMLQGLIAKAEIEEGVGEF